MNYTIYSQHPEPKEIAVGSLSVGADGRAYIFSDDICVAELHRARMDFAAELGIMISGMEPVGRDRYRYQQWWCIYPSGPVAQSGEHRTHNP